MFWVFWGPVHLLNLRRLVSRSSLPEGSNSVTFSQMTYSNCTLLLIVVTFCNTDPLWRNSSVTGGFPLQRVNDAAWQIHVGCNDSNLHNRSLVRSGFHARQTRTLHLSDWPTELPRFSAHGVINVESILSQWHDIRWQCCVCRVLCLSFVKPQSLADIKYLMVDEL